MTVIRDVFTLAKHKSMENVKAYSGRGFMESLFAPYNGYVRYTSSMRPYSRRHVCSEEKLRTKRYSRDARIIGIHEGSSEIQHLAISGNKLNLRQEMKFNAVTILMYDDIIPREKP